MEHNMKSLKNYVVESASTYSYRIKIAGDPGEAYDKFKELLQRYDLESITDPKKTPITKNPVGFPGLENEEVFICDVTVKYPASADQIIDLGRLAGITPANMVVIDKQFDDSMDAEYDRQEENTRLENDYPAASKDSVDLSKKYSESFQDIVQNAADTTFEVAGGKTAAAKTTNDFKQGTDSPMTKQNKITTPDDVAR